MQTTSLAAPPTSPHDEASSTLVERPQVRARLRGLVCSLVNGVASQEDLLQEALLHLWLLQEDHPEMTLSWYLANCAFHIRHLLRQGHSLDAPKRHTLGQPLEADIPGATLGPEIADPGPGPFERSTFHDLLHEVAARLSPTDNKTVPAIPKGRPISWADWLAERRARRETGNGVAPGVIRRPSSSSDRRLRKLFHG